MSYGGSFGAVATTTVAQLRTGSCGPWRDDGIGYLRSLLVMGILGETRLSASRERGTPVKWLSDLALVLPGLLIAVIGATFVPARQPKRLRRGGPAGAGLSGVVGTLVTASSVCNPPAIPLFGSAGALSFLAPERGLIALRSVALFAMTLALRRRTARRGELTMVTGDSDTPRTMIDAGASK